MLKIHLTFRRFRTHVRHGLRPVTQFYRRTLESAPVLGYGDPVPEYIPNVYISTENGQGTVYETVMRGDGHITYHKYCSNRCMFKLVDMEFDSFRVGMMRFDATTKLVFRVSRTEFETLVEREQCTPCLLLKFGDCLYSLPILHRYL